MNERTNELISEILKLCDGADAVAAVTALTTALSVVIHHAAAPDRVPALTADVIRTLQTAVTEMRERAGSPPPPQLPTVN